MLLLASEFLMNSSLPYVYTIVLAIHSWRNAGLWTANIPCPALGLQPTGDNYVGEPSATGQPTRPTQLFILPRSINE